MPFYRIAEYDRDYHAITNTEIMEFASKEEADEYCKKKSWAGHSYWAKELNKVKPGPEIDDYPVLR